MTHSRRSGWPAWSQRARMPSATAGRVLEQRVRPRHEVRVVRVGAAEDRVAAGRGDDAHRLRAVDLARRGDHHPDRRRLAAAGARAGAADVADGVLAEHQVGQRLLVAVRRRASAAASGRSACRGVPLERALAGRLVGDLVDHHAARRGRAPRRPRRTPRSPCSGRVDEDPERRRLEAALAPARRRTSVSRRSGAVAVGCGDGRLRLARRRTSRSRASRPASGTTHGEDRACPGRR